MGLGLECTEEKKPLGLPFPDDAYKSYERALEDGHMGIDWGILAGTPVCAMYDGTVTEVVTSHVRGSHPHQVLELKSQQRLGNRVIMHSDTGSGNGFEAVYGHLSQVFVEAGQFVKKGALLGLSGHTGWSSGPHLHVEVKPFIRPGAPGAPIDFQNCLPTSYKTYTYTWPEPEVTWPADYGDTDTISLYSRPDSSTKYRVGTLAAPVATWIKSYTPSENEELHVLSVGEGILSLRLADYEFSENLTAGIGVTLTVTNVSFSKTEGSYVAVEVGTLPANLRPPVRIAQKTVGSVQLYVSQNGKIYYRNTGTASATVSEADLSWPLAYSVIGKDRPTGGSWWQVVVPGLDLDAKNNTVAGMIGWVQNNEIIKQTYRNKDNDQETSFKDKWVGVTWPPPPYQLEAIGTFSTTRLDKARIDLAWQAPKDLWTGAEDIAVSSYQILRGSSPKTLTDHVRTSNRRWGEFIPVTDTFYYAVAGLVGTNRGLHSLASISGPGATTSTSSDRPVLTVLSRDGVNVRAADNTGADILGTLSPGDTVRVVAHNDGDKSQGAKTGRWWQIESELVTGWVSHQNVDGTEELVSVTNEDDVPIFVGGGGTGGGGWYLDPAAPVPAAAPVPSAGQLYARQGLAAGAAGDRLRRWPAQDAAELPTTLRANVWYTVRRLFARTGLEDLWLEVAPHSAIPSGSATGPAGWVPLGRLALAARGTPPLPPAARFVRLQSWVTAGARVRSGPDTAYARYQTLRDRSAWYRLEGQNAAATWYRIEYTAGRLGWIYAGLVDIIAPVAVPLAALPIQTVPQKPPLEPGPTGEAATGTTSTVGQAKGDFRNLVTNPDGRWSVAKTGRTVSLSFDCPRSPVQYYARQNPQPQFVLPAAFRPTRTVTHTVTGTEVDEHREALPGAPAVTFTVRIETDGEVRYVDNRQVDHVGYVRYGVRALSYPTATALVAPVDPAPPGDLSDSGTYHNRQVNWGSRWTLKRKGNAVSGSFTTTRSPAEYYANQNREALLWLPAAYWPDRDVRFQVKGAVRVNTNGSTSTDTRKVNFWITVRRRDGRMYYDRDTSLKTQGVGYLSYTVNVSWTAAPRITVPGAPRDLEADDIEAEEVALDWEAPAANGGARIDEYRVEVYRNGSWREVEDDISRRRYDVEDLAPYTRYSFRVRAHNRAGWSAPSPALTVTTLRAAPGTPGTPTATATHERVHLSWRAPTTGGTVTGYRIQRRVGSGSWQTQVPDTGATTPGWTDRTVQAATGYSYRVAADNYGALGAWSSARSVTTAATPTIPGQVTALAAAPGTASRLELNWAEPSNTGGGVTGYQVERAPDATPRAWATVVADTGSAAPRWGDDAVAADTVVHYRVSACNSAGMGPASAEAMGHSRPQLRLLRQAAYPLTAHSEPRADAPVTATFTAYQPGESYELVGQVPGADGWWQLQLRDPAFRDACWVPAVTGRATGSTTDLPQPPAAPGAFTATLAGGQVTLSWTAPPSGAPVTGYRLWRQTDGAAFAPLGSDLAATALTHTDTTVQNGHVYRYWLQALSAEEGPGVPTVTVALAVMATPVAPAAVTAVTAQATSTTLQLTWTRATTGGLPTGYRVAWREAGTDDFYWEVGVTGTTHPLTGLIPGTRYALRVTAFNQEGTAPVTTHTATTVPEAPGVPEAVAVAVTGQDATVSWQAPTAGGRPDAYHLQVKPQATAAWPATPTPVTGLSHSLTGLGYAVAHDLRVRAANAAGESTWVTTTFTTAAAPPLPAAPTGLTAAPGADSPMQLTWTAPTTGGGAPAGYRIERSADVDPRVWTEIVADTGTAATTWDDQGLAAATVYHYRVTGRNAAGLGPSSAEAAGTTRPQAALRATAPYPLTAHRWPETVAPVTHTWPAQDTTVTLDVAGQVRGTHGWYRVLRFGQVAHGPYWLPAAALTVTGATTAVPQAPGVPGTFQGTATAAAVTLTWSAPTTGGPVTGYRLWRQAGTGAWAVLGTVLAAATLTHTDTTGAPGTTYRYRVQARSAAGYGPRTAALTPATAGPVPAAPVLTLYAHPGRVTLIVRGASGTVQQALAWSGPVSGTTTLTGRSGYHRLVVPGGHTLTVRARSQDGAGRWSAWVTRTLTTR